MSPTTLTAHFIPTGLPAGLERPLARTDPANIDLCPTEPIDVTEIGRLLGEQ